MIYTITLNPSIDYVVHVDTFQLGSLNKMSKDIKLPGGKGINVSRILQRLDTPSTALGFLGGFTGSFIKDWIKKEQIMESFTTIQDDTRINIKLKEKVETEINGQGPHITTTEIAQLKKSLTAIKEKDIVVLSGSVPPALPQNFYKELIEIIKDKKAEFIIDTTGDDLLSALDYHPLLIKPNNHELEEIFQLSFSSIEEMIPYGKKLLEMGAQNVLISLGGNGALLFIPEGVYQSNVPIGTLKNSVGAGDSMIAGFLSNYVHSKNSVRAFKLGVAAGSATAFSNDLATKDEIRQLSQTIIIKKISEQGVDKNGY